MLLLFDIDGTLLLRASAEHATALHEALHILLHDFKVVCGNPRADDSILVNAEHGIVNLLEKLLFQREKSSARK